MIQIEPAKIKDVIGKGGDTINGIIDETGVKIDIDQDGKVSIASADAEMIKSHQDHRRSDKRSQSR